MKNRNLNHVDDWATPPEFLEKIKKEFGEFFDPCPWKHDVGEWDGLSEPWGEINFINPPYSLKLKSSFVNKAVTESGLMGSKNIMLLPVSTSTKLFHRIIEPHRIAPIRFLPGRLRFIGINDKGQYCNFDQIQGVTKETIDFKGVEIPKFVKRAGMHDSMLVIF